MKQGFLKVMMLCLLMVGMTVPGSMANAAEHKEQSTAKKGCISPATFKLASDMRKLWFDHVVWTRNYIVSAVDGL